MNGNSSVVFASLLASKAGSTEKSTFWLTTFRLVKEGKLAHVLVLSRSQNVKSVTFLTDKAERILIPMVHVRNKICHNN